MSQRTFVERSSSGMTVSQRVTVLHGIFFLSGVAGLGYQMVWLRMFAIGLGHEIPGALAVVAAFFGGLTLGSWTLDGKVGRSSQPGHWYVALELLIGLWGFASIWLIGWFNDLAIQMIGIDPSPLWHWSVAFVLPLIALLPATVAMGATLPAMERYVSPLTRHGRCVGGLYAANTAGAVAGTLASAFFFMPWFGLGATVGSLSVINFVCAAAVMVIGRGDAARPTVQPTTSVTTDTPRWHLGLLLFLTGLLGIGYEVLGIRVLSQVLENTVYSFAAILSIYLLGTACGAAAYQRFARRFTYVTLLGHLLCGLALSCMLGVFSLSVAQLVYARVRNDYFGDSMLGVMGSETVVAAMVFAVPTLIMGAVFSHLIQGFKRADGGVGRAVAVNTLGGALAPLVFGVAVFPLVGAKWALVSLSLAYLLLIPRKAGVAWLWEAIPLVLVLALPQNLHVITKRSGQVVADYRQGVMAAVAVVQDEGGHYSLRVNNRFRMGATDPEGVRFECLQGQVPLLLHPNPKRALFLGLGTAITFRSAAFEPGLRADGVELVPEVVQVLHYFKPANLPEDADDNQTIFVADARRFVQTVDHQYDVVVADLFHPGRDGAGSLYTLEHFQSVRERLTPGGLFCQWLPLYQLDEPMLQVIIQTFLEVFPHTRAYLVDFEINNPALGLVATTQPISYPADWFERRVQDDRLRRYLKGLVLNNGVRLLGSCIADADQLRSYASGASINTDNDPIVTFNAPKFTSQQDATSYGRLLTLLDHCHLEAKQVLSQGHSQSHNATTDRFANRLSNFITARDTYIRGTAALAQGRLQQAVDAYVESAGLSVDFTPAYARCLAMAKEQAKTDRRAARELLTRLANAQPNRPEAKQWLEQLPER